MPQTAPPSAGVTSACMAATGRSQSLHPGYCPQSERVSPDQQAGSTDDVAAVTEQGRVPLHPHERPVNLILDHGIAGTGALWATPTAALVARRGDRRRSRTRRSRLGGVREASQPFDRSRSPAADMGRVGVGRDDVVCSPTPRTLSGSPCWSPRPSSGSAASHPGCARARPPAGSARERWCPPLGSSPGWPGPPTPP
jgi:hypothetical protein